MCQVYNELNNFLIRDDKGKGKSKGKTEGEGKGKGKHRGYTADYRMYNKKKVHRLELITIEVCPKLYSLTRC